MNSQSNTLNTSTESFVNKNTGFIFYALVIVFWLGQLWCSPYASFDNNLAMGTPYSHHLNPIMRIIDRVLDEPSLVGNRFSKYEVSLVVLALYIFMKFKNYMCREKFYVIFFGVSLLAVLVSLINPNNSFDKIKYLLTYQPRVLYVYILFLYTFTFLRSDVLSIILKKFFIVGSISAICLAVYSLFAFLIGKGPILFGHMTTLPNAEHLDWMSIFSAVFLALYFKDRKKIYLAYVLLFHLVVFFGDRRTQIGVLLASDVMLIAYYLKENLMLRLPRFLIPGLLLFLAVFVVVNVLDMDISYYYDRVCGIFFPERYYDARFSDGGHFDQTTTTFKTLLSNLDKFWGAGMRNEMNYVEGQSGYIHNSFVDVWAIYGLHMVLFYLFVFLIFLRKTVSFYIKKTSPLKIIVAAVTFTYFMIIIGTAFTGEYIFKNFYYVTQFVLIISAFKINENTFKLTSVSRG